MRKTYIHIYIYTYTVYTHSLIFQGVTRYGEVIIQSEKKN